MFRQSRHGRVPARCIVNDILTGCSAVAEAAERYDASKWLVGRYVLTVSRWLSQDNANLFMVLEFISGGEMFTHLRNSNRFR